MELCGATSFAWTNSITTSIHITQPFSIYGAKRFRIWCVTNDAGSAHSNEGTEMTVSVTGATGFIGRRLVQRLHADNHRVRVLTRSRSKAQVIFPGKKSGTFQEL
ncbi:epimerase family protein SDR39U1 homolog, chloroplastic-like isoform X2 [Camellia sinensis]|uniref:epimerase family protein SDR39U1 homolog, chloroplastic-like isoform X2 n=1 Tax=Camellia sinensis TaxID=4442 RepID=UPI0010361173|nr:epimerase family protein SDR39U1 homolog, chloroplastic-like isoform X2 [Camellia sinensis]